MGEDIIPFFGEVKDQMKNIIKVAGVAKDMGILTVGVVTIPFFFEKKRKIIKALKGVDELRKNVDALLIVNNERLCDVYADSDLSVKEAFVRADNILMDAVKGISELITLPSDGGIKSDFRDVETTIKDGGGAIMAMGRASGDHRVERAILNALDSPLDPNIDVIWGTATDDSLGEDAKGRLSRLVITEDYRFILEDYHKEVELQPVHKAVYLLFLAHPEGIEFKRLADYREELTRYYMATAKIMDKEKVQSYAETHRRLQPYLVRTAEGNHPPEGVGGCCYSNVTSWMC